MNVSKSDEGEECTYITIIIRERSSRDFERTNSGRQSGRSGFGFMPGRKRVRLGIPADDLQLIWAAAPRASSASTATATVNSYTIFMYNTYTYVYVSTWYGSGCGVFYLFFFR